MNKKVTGTILVVSLIFVSILVFIIAFRWLIYSGEFIVMQPSIRLSVDEETTFIIPFFDDDKTINKKYYVFQENNSIIVNIENDVYSVKLLLSSDGNKGGSNYVNDISDKINLQINGTEISLSDEKEIDYVIDLVDEEEQIFDVIFRFKDDSIFASEQIFSKRIVVKRGN